MTKKQNIVWSHGYLSTEEYEQRNGHKSVVIWLTGLSGSGKSTIAKALQKRLFDDGIQVSVLDGDNIRHGLNSDLGFSEEDRKENIRRIAEVAKLFQSHGFIVITAFISPYKVDRDQARNIIEPSHFIEVFLDVDIEVCEARDPKGLYKKARAGEIPTFTGITDPYESPDKPELVLSTNNQSVDQSVTDLYNYLVDTGIIEG